MVILNNAICNKQMTYYKTNYKNTKIMYFTEI